MKKDIFFLIAQFFLFAFYFIDVSFGIADTVPHWLSYLCLTILILGCLIIVFGIVNMSDSLSPFPKPKPNASLISNGIYNYVRHPIYIGIVLAMIAYGVYTFSIFKIAISLILFGVFYFKTEAEEQYLLHKFEGYATYKQKTGRFFPKFPSKK